MLVTLIVGPPASGKTTEAQRLLLHQPTAVRLNRDERGGSLEALVPAMQAALRAGQDVILDNLFTTQMDRKPFIEQAKQLGAEVECIYLDLDIESCTINACMRMMKNHGHLLSPSEIKKSSNPNDIPPTVLFRFRKRFEMSSKGEGFSSVQCVQGYKHTFTGSNKAVILDYDGTLRETLGGLVFCMSIFCGRQPPREFLGFLNPQLTPRTSQAIVRHCLAFADIFSGPVKSAMRRVR